MASLDFIARQLRVLANYRELSIDDTEQELRWAIIDACNGITPDRMVTIAWGNGSHFHPAKKPFFPEWVFLPHEDNSGQLHWYKDHEWGQGPNEDEETLLRELKKILAYKAGYSSWNDWESQRNWDPEYFQKVKAALRETRSGRGPSSPYTQNSERELELALEFSPELILEWYHSMHWKGWSDFVDQMYLLWKRWGSLAIWEVHQVCGDRIRWFAIFATGEADWHYDENNGWEQVLKPEYTNHRQALNTWKRSNWVHAICKISSDQLAKCDRIHGRRAVDATIRDNQEVLNQIPEENRHHALTLLLSGDKIDWLAEENWGNGNIVFQAIAKAKEIDIKPSVFAKQASVIMTWTGLNWSDVIDQKIPWSDIVSLAEKHGEEIIAITQGHSRQVALEVLYLGDSIRWLTDSLEWQEPRWVINKARELGIFPSEVAVSNAALKDLGLDFSQIQILAREISWETVIWWPFQFQSVFAGIPKTNLPSSIVDHHRLGDDVSWMLSATADEVKLAREWGKVDGRMPSEVFLELEILKSAGLDLNQIRRLRDQQSSSYWYSGGGGSDLEKIKRTGLMFSQLCPVLDWSRVVLLARNFSEQVNAVISACRPTAVGLLYQNEVRNTLWWPQAITVDEFVAGHEAEKISREGLFGIQRRRWLGEHLGLPWIPKVDENLSWEESVEIIHSNPWLKTALNFVNKEEVILQIASGQDVSYLKYSASAEECEVAKKAAWILSSKLQAIKNSWSEDIRDWFEKLTEAVGEQTAWDYIGNRHRHDQLFFVETMLQKLPPESQPLGQILLQVRTNFQRFGQVINAFEPDGTQFQSFKEFVKYTDLQKGQIVFPQGSPEVLREKVAEMLEAPGVSVAAIREFVRDPKNWLLMTGEEDGSAVFPAMRLEFTVEPLSYLLQQALGQRRSDRPEDRPKAERPELLFKRLSALAKRAGLKSAADLTKNVPEKIEQEALAILREHNSPIGLTYVAEVARKSDPRGWTCGDWTSCCMQFGSTKNNEYMRRRDMAYFLVSRDGRPIAQSVVVAAASVNRNGDTPKLESARLNQLDGVALDNVEVAPNYKSHNPQIERCYREFWRRYVTKFAVGDRISVFVGKSHNDAWPATATVPTAWKPLQSIHHSDCFGNSEVYMLYAAKKENKTERKKEAGL